jgi:short-subunit dehydrogenase
MEKHKQRVVVVGASRGLGRGIVEVLAARGYEVIAVARDEKALAEVASETGARTIVADATEASTPTRILGEFAAALLVVVAGAPPVLQPVHLQTWESFSLNWNVDTKIAFE